jgi:putative nucleotidyltransferase with HDIG domain
MINSVPSAETVPSASRPDQPIGVLPVALAGLCPARLLDFSLYLRIAPEKPLKLYRGRNFPLRQDDLDRLLERGVTTLYVPSQDREAYQQYLRREVIENECLPPGKRYQVLRESTRAIFEAAFRQPSPDMAVHSSREFGAHLATIICRQDMVLQDLFSLMDHDYYTYTHAVNVSTYSVALANRLQIADQAGLNAIATGALLHDIGKRRVESIVLNKRGVLDSAERTHIQQHSRLGFRELSQRQDLAWGQLMMIYQHHERPDGRGYPVGLEAKDLHPWARLCSVADVFDALTTARSYRQPLSLEAALDQLADQAGTALDKEMVECWTAIMSCRT